METSVLGRGQRDHPERLVPCPLCGEQLQPGPTASSHFESEHPGTALPAGLRPTARWSRRLRLGLLLLGAPVLWVFVATAVIEAHESDGFARGMKEMAIGVCVAPIFLVGLALTTVALIGWVAAAHRARHPGVEAEISAPPSLPVAEDGLAGRSHTAPVASTGGRARGAPVAAALAISGFEILVLALIVNSMALAVGASVIAVAGGAIGVASHSRRLGPRLLVLTAVILAVVCAGLTVNEIRDRLAWQVPRSVQTGDVATRAEACARLQRGEVPVGAAVMMPSETSSDAVSCQLRGVNLAGAQLADAGLWNTDLSGANLAGANLRHARFDHANLTGANLRGADLSDAILLDVRFVNADLTDAVLTGSMVNNADFTGATWHNTTCPSGLTSELLGGTCVGSGRLRTRPT